MSGRRLPLLLAVVVGATGCGDLSRDELGRRVDSLSAIAAEGRLIARDVARDRTRSTFVRVQARTLGEAATHEAEKVTDATPAPGTDAHRRRAVALAEDLAGALDELATHPGDERRATEIGRRLITVQDDLDTLGGQT